MGVRPEPAGARRTTAAHDASSSHRSTTIATTGHATTVRRLERATGQLASATIARMERRPWYKAMPPDERSWVGLVIQAGIAAFVDWYRDPGQNGPKITADVFGTAPRELLRAMTLQQTVQVVRVAIEVVEETVPDVVGADAAPTVREAVLRYSREVAFATADVYARAAEARGAWDARLEALVVDSVVRGEADDEVRSKAAALGWTDPGNVCVAMGWTPVGDSEAVVDAIRRAARHSGYNALTGSQGDRVVAILGGADDPIKAAEAVCGHFGPGPVVVGELVPDLVTAAESARSAAAGLRAANGWPDAPVPVLSSALLPERALAGDDAARRTLKTELYQPIVDAGPVVIETLAAYLETGGSVEAAARLLFVHPNTVRYRLRRVGEVTGLMPTDARDSYTLRVALTLGRLECGPARDPRAT